MIPQSLETFSVGYCNGSMRNALPKSGELIEQLQAIGILNARGNEIFYGRVVVPILDASGNVAGPLRPSAERRRAEAHLLAWRAARRLQLRCRESESIVDPGRIDLRRDELVECGPAQRHLALRQGRMDRRS